MSRSRRASTGLPFPAILALRYLKSTRRDAFVSFLSAVAGGGIALGVASLILALAALSGFQQSIRREILARTPDLEVELPPGSDGRTIRDQTLAVPGVAGAQLTVQGRGWLIAGGKVQPAVLTGFEGEVPASFPGAAGGAPGLYVGSLLAERWGLAPGDTVEVASTRPTLTPLGPQPRVRRLPLAGTFDSGRTAEEERVALPLEDARILLGGAELRLQVSAGSLEGALSLVPRLRQVLPAGSTVRTWRDLNRPLFFALRLEKAVMFVAVFLIVLVAALALVSDLTLIIASKRAEIGMLGAMGAPATSLRRAFLLLGGFLAGLGALIGGGLGVGGSWLLDRYRVVRLPGQVYYLDYVPFAVRTADLGAVLLLTLGLALLCAFHAARRAAALDPAEALRR